MNYPLLSTLSGLYIFPNITSIFYYRKVFWKSSSETLFSSSSDFCFIAFTSTNLSLSWVFSFSGTKRSLQGPDLMSGGAGRRLSSHFSRKNHEREMKNGPDVSYFTRGENVNLLIGKKKIIYVERNKILQMSTWDTVISVYMYDIYRMLRFFV